MIVNARTSILDITRFKIDSILTGMADAGLAALAEGSDRGLCCLLIDSAIFEMFLKPYCTIHS